MYSVLKASHDGRLTLAEADTAADGPDPDPADPWLFTDPAAQAAYARQDRLGHLEHDIHTHVMYCGCWAPDELAYKRELRRLLRAGLLIPAPAFGHLSPHPTIYTALDEGVLEVAGHKLHLVPGDDVVYEPWLARVTYPGLAGPLRVGRFQCTTDLRLCGEAFPQAVCLCERGLAVLRQTLPRRVDRPRR